MYARTSRILQQKLTYYNTTSAEGLCPILTVAKRQKGTFMSLFHSSVKGQCYYKH